MEAASCTIDCFFVDVQTRNWDFHVRDHTELIGKLQNLRPHVIVERLPGFVLSCVNGEKADYSNIDLSRVDPELGGALMPFQQEGVR